MNLTEYLKLCTRLEKYCAKVRAQPTLIESDTLLNGFKSCLYQEQEWGELSDDCKRVERTSIAGYRKTLAVFEHLKALINDIEAGKVNCPQGLKVMLVWRLKNIYAPCEELSRSCIAEFNKHFLVNITPESEAKFRKFFSPEFNGRRTNEDKFAKYLMPEFQRCRNEKEVGVLAKTIYNSNIFAAFKDPKSFKEWCKSVSEFCSIEEISYKECQLVCKQLDWL